MAFPQGISGAVRQRSLDFGENCQGDLFRGLGADVQSGRTVKMLPCLDEDETAVAA